MKIAIDAQTTLGQKTGFGFYVENLINNIQKIDHKNKYDFILPADYHKDLSSWRRLIWDQIGFPAQAGKNKPDLIHQPCFSAPTFHGNAKTVITVHDIISLRFGNDLPFFARQYFKKIMPFSYRYADHIICDSNFTKHDLMKYLKIPENKITVIYLAPKKIDNTINSDDIKEIKKKYNLGNKYLLNIGTISPRKNLEFLVQVFSEVIKSNPDLKLVIVGKKNRHYEKLLSQVKNLNLEEKVIFTGYLPDRDSEVLYKGADIFLFPSLYEGFGLPPLEAMSYGTPVISSNASSLPEAVGENGILLSPTDKFGWVREIKHILSDSKFRNRIIKCGLEQAKKFSWEKCAKETIAVYEKVYYLKD